MMTRTLRQRRTWKIRVHKSRQHRRAIVQVRNSAGRSSNLPKRKHHLQQLSECCLIHCNYNRQLGLMPLLLLLSFFIGNTGVNGQQQQPPQHLISVNHTGPISRCEHNDFACRIDPTICIPRMKWQDGVTDCPDASDEECLIWQYDCKFGKPRCVDLRNLNDGSIDCMSGFDEACPPHFYVCMDRGDCIAPDRYLDGKVDCSDGSDEPCPAAHFLCHDRSRCIPLRRYQDGNDDCPDGSDEACTLFQYECACGWPRCIDMQLYNDGQPHCDDASDEKSNTKTKSKCADGSSPRNRTQRVNGRSRMQAGPPMQLCGDDHVNLCRKELNEICLVIGGTSRCMCRVGHIRPPGATKCILAPRSVSEGLLWAADDPSGNLLVTKEEQQDKSATCNPIDPKACIGRHEKCQELPDTRVFVCACEDGYTRHAQSGSCVALIDECQDPEMNDCDPNAICMDNALSYECLCRQGYIDMSPLPAIKPGMHCLPLTNECEHASQHDCSPNADCIDLPGTFTCQCKVDYFDVSPNRAKKPGRVCSKEHKSEKNNNETSSESVDEMLLLRNESSGESNECITGANDCHPAATCIDTPQGYKCNCTEGYVDVSRDPMTKPGRQCALLQNECSSRTQNDCDPDFGECVDVSDGYVCRCKPGYVDTNPRMPGRRCQKTGARF